MAGRRSRFTWEPQQLSANIKNAKPAVNRAIVAAFAYQARRSENYMRTNAKWTDQTSNARNGLKATPQHSGDQHSIILSHSVPYGIWLEVRWSGKYGVIPDAVRQGGQELMGLLTKLFEGVG